MPRSAGLPFKRGGSPLGRKGRRQGSARGRKGRMRGKGGYPFPITKNPKSEGEATHPFCGLSRDARRGRRNARPAWISWGGTAEGWSPLRTERVVCFFAPQGTYKELIDIDQ